MSSGQQLGVVCFQVLAMVVGSAPLGANAQWTVVNLHPPGAIESRALGIHGAQQVGQADFGVSRALLWTGASSTWTDLNPAGGASSELFDAFDGQQVGAVQSGGAGHASLWTGSPSSWVDLHPAGATFSAAEGVGGHQVFPGLVRQVGASMVGGVHRASLWSGTAASWTDLHPPAASFSIAWDVDNDQQVGMAMVAGTNLASLWTGTPASWISLHPPGGVTSSATGVHGGQQVGFVDVGGNIHHASLWTGTSASWVDLHPGAGISSQVHRVYAGRQAGEVRVPLAHASVWSGTAASWVDLHSYLGPQYTGGASSARGIWSDGTTTYVAGYAFNTAVSRYEAILWVETVAPAHDDCTSAQPQGDGTTLFSNVSATTDGPAEPSCLPGFDGQDDSDVWYEYVAGCEGNVNLEVHPGNFDTLWGVYSGSCGGTLLACGLASLGVPVLVVTLPAVAGETFIVRLGGLPGQQGVGNLTINCVPSIGACCDSSSVCAEVSPSTCLAIGGTYYGDGTTCAGVSCPPPAPQIDFTSPATVATGMLPVAVAAGDYDLDGDNDLAVCDRASQTFTVLRNDGTGTFQFTYAGSVGNLMQEDAVAADLDADGDLDLAIAAQGGILLERNVNAALGFWMTLGVGTSDVRAIIAEDFDGDCSIDLATANPNGPPGNNVAVLLNVNGDFSQPSLTLYSAGTTPIDLAAADVDADGFLDIVAVNATSGDITVLYNNGAGIFSTSTNFTTGLGCCPSAVAVGDLDGDSLPDAVVTNFNTTQVAVLLNDGVGGFGSAMVMSVGNSPWDVAVADLDGDDDQDVLLVFPNFPSHIAVLTNDGSGAFYAPLTFTVNGGPLKLAVAHLNAAQDGALDVAVPLSAFNEVAVLLNVGDQDCNANAVADHNEPGSSLNFVISGSSNATPCSFRAYGTGFDVQGEFCVTSGAGSAAFVGEVIERLNEAGCPGIRAQRIDGMVDGFTVSAPGNVLDFCIGNAPGPATCCFSSSAVCSCNPDFEEFFFSGEDCNKNGMDDAIDLYTGTLKDVDENGIPDDCALSCSADLNGSTECADADGDGLRDEGCTWWACESGTCQATTIGYADMGGAFGACPVDGATDANDRFHALNCFSNSGTDGAIPYPCEPASPSATNVDAGGAFGQCCPDGVCDGNDAFHALNAFAGSNPCHCPANFVCPCPTPTEPPENPVLCPAGAMPGVPSSGVEVVDVATVVLQASSETVRPGGLVQIDVLLASRVSDLRGYQLHVAATGGLRGNLELVDIVIEDRKDSVFAGLADWRAFNVQTQQMLAGLDSAGTGTRPGAYLATFVFEASGDAAGTFTIELLRDDADPLQRTFLFPTPAGARIAVGTVKPAVVTVERTRSRVSR